jgi:ectoine hydroxylase-related dioxygenase (phytanoyl-CoA dioxygenase family)
VPWHRDPSGRALIDDVGDASSDFTCDIYIDPSTLDNGCLWALPGTHRAGGPDLADASPDFDVPGARALEAQPGDMIIHSTGVLHGSPTNTSSSVRRTLYLHYRTPAEIVGEYWQRPQEWVDERAAEFARYAAQRMAEGLDADADAGTAAASRP